MPDRCVLQPNGMYARFSTTCNHFTEYNCTEPQILAVFSAIHRLRVAQDKVHNAIVPSEVKRRFEESILIISEIHGFDEADGIRKILTAPLAPECTCRIGNGLHTDRCPVFKWGRKYKIGFGHGSSVRIDRGEPPHAEMKPLKFHGGHSLGVHGVCPECGQNHGPLGNIPVAPWGSFDRPADDIAKAIVSHATKPLVSPERRRDVELFARTIKLVEEAYGLKLKGDTDLSGDILIFDQQNTLPPGYEFSAYIEPDGKLEFTEWVLDDETEATKQ